MPADRDSAAVDVRRVEEAAPTTAGGAGGVLAPGRAAGARAESCAILNLQMHQGPDLNPDLAFCSGS